MSAGRAHRRRLERAKKGQAYRNSRGERPVFLTSDGTDDYYLQGTLLIVVPTIRDDMPAEMASAITTRRQADFTGRCACGATATVRRGRVVIAHGRGCHASNEALRELVRSTGWKP